MRRVFAALLLLAVLVGAGGLIATTAYQAGLSAAVTTSGGTAVQPVFIPAYGFGWHVFGLGYGFLGFLGTLLFIFLIFALIRVVIFGGRRRGGWGGPGRWAGGPGAGGSRSPWEGRAHQAFDDWHRDAHGATPDAAPSGPSGSGSGTSGSGPTG